MKYTLAGLHKTFPIFCHALFGRCKLLTELLELIQILSRRQSGSKQNGQNIDEVNVNEQSKFEDTKGIFPRQNDQLIIIAKPNSSITILEFRRNTHQVPIR